MCARPASELWAAGFRDVCRPWACACGDAHPMGQPGGACFSPPSHRTRRLRAEPRVQFWRTADSLVITPVELVLCPDAGAPRETRLLPPTAYTLRSSRTASFTAPLPTLHSTKPRYFPAEVTRRGRNARNRSPPASAATCQLITNPRRVSQRTIYIIWELFNGHVHVSPRGEHAAPRLHARHGRSLSV